MDLTNIKNLVFDLGGVIINLHIEATLEEFSRLSGKTLDEIKASYFRPEFFYQYEKGLIDDVEFSRALSAYMGITLSIDQVEKAWCKMLGEIHPERVEMLKKLSENYNLLLLSNTNRMHLDVFNDILFRASGVPTMNDLFHKVYYSHEIHMRKPDDEIFLHVLRDSNIVAEETIFLDDTMENLVTAQRLGINTFHVTSPDVWVKQINER